MKKSRFKLTTEHDRLSKTVYQKYLEIPVIKEAISELELQKQKEAAYYPNSVVRSEIELEKQILGYSGTPIAKIDAKVEIRLEKIRINETNWSSATNRLFIIEIKPKIDSFIQFLGQMNKYKELYHRKGIGYAKLIGIFYTISNLDAEILGKHGIKCYTYSELTQSFNPVN